MTQNLDTRVNDTYWVQQTTAAVDPGTALVVGESAPTGDWWELAAVEVTPAG